MGGRGDGVEDSVAGKSDKPSIITYRKGGAPMAMFDPHYVSSVLADILSRETGVELEFILTPKEKGDAPPEHGEKSA